MTGPVRTPRLDPAAAVAGIAAATGVRLTVDGPAPGGQTGAVYVRLPDGRPAVLTTARADTRDLVAAARAAGLPAPHHHLLVTVAGTRYAVQQRLPGRPAPAPAAAHVHALLDLVGRCAGLLRHRTDLPPAALHLTADGPGFCRHGPLAAHSPRTARLLDRIRAAAADTTTADGTDLVHYDLHPGNVLTVGDRVTGVVDWDGATRGDRHLDLVTLRFHLTRAAPHLSGPVDDALAGLDPGRLRAYWAHLSLRQVDWALRHHGPAAADAWLTVAERGPPRR